MASASTRRESGARPPVGPGAYRYARNAPPRPAACAQVFFYKRYEKADFVRDAVFENTLSESAKHRPGGGTTLEADHSKLDHCFAEDSTAGAAPIGRQRRTSLAGCLRARSHRSSDGGVPQASSFKTAKLASVRGITPSVRLRSTRRRSPSEEIASGSSVLGAAAAEAGAPAADGARAVSPVRKRSFDFGGPLGFAKRSSTSPPPNGTPGTQVV